MRSVQITLAAIAVLTIPLIWVGVQALMPESVAIDSGGGGGLGIDSGARIEIEVLRQQVEALQDQVTTLEQEVAGLSVGSTSYNASAALAPLAEGTDEPAFNDGENAIGDSYPQVVLIANRRNVNKGITVASPSFLEGFLGRPREVLTDNCESMTNLALKELLVVEQVGPIKVTMLRPALDSMKRVFEKVQAADPDLYARISTAGSLCVRRIRGTIDRTSTHSFGLAVDLNIDGQLDTFTDGKTQLGLTILADFFIAEGWVWGAGFGREDSMHFEVSRQQLETWRAEGKI